MRWVLGGARQPADALWPLGAGGAGPLFYWTGAAAAERAGHGETAPLWIGQAARGPALRPPDPALAGRLRTSLERAPNADGGSR